MQLSNDQLVQLPQDILAGSQKFEIINILGSIARYTVPGAYAGNTAERDLEIRFSNLPTIGLSDAAGWLSGIGAKLQPLDDQIATLSSGDPEPLHQALQAGNDAQCVQLLAINDASKLIEMEEAGEDQLSPHPMWSKSDPCLLLRLGYSKDQDYAVYAASLPGDSRRYIKITWQSVVTAGINAALAVLPPPKPVDMDHLTALVDAQTEDLARIHQRHADILEAIGRLPGTSAQTITPQAV